jgi:hypothetical protein
MISFPINKPSSYFKNSILFLIIFISSIFLNHGSLGGDEGKIVAVSTQLAHSHLPFFSFLKSSNFEGVLLYHLPWVIITSLNIALIDLVFHLLSVTPSLLVRDWLIAYPPAFFAGISALIIFNALIKEGITSSVSIITTLVIFLLTPISGFLTGGWSECYLIFFISIRILLFNKEINNKSIVLVLGFIDATLIFFKAYSIFFVTILSPIFNKKLSQKKKLLYLLSFVISLSIILALKFAIPREVERNIFGPIFQLPEFNTYAGRLYDSFFSLNFGVLMIPPFAFLLFNIYSINKNLNFLLVTLAFCITLLFLCLYPFWHGALGIAGQRYISPFILFFAPYFAHAIRNILKKYPKFILLIILLVFLYIPAMNYRNTLIDVYAGLNVYSNEDDHFAHTNFPVNNPEFHPALFASTIIFKNNFLNDSEITINNAKGFVAKFNSANIIPMTGISRIFLIQSNKLVPTNNYKFAIIKSSPKILSIFILILLYLMPFLLIIFAWKEFKNEDLQKSNSKIIH